MLGDFLQHQVEQPRSHFLKVQYDFWDSELSCRWLGKDGEASVGREGSFKLLIYINKTFVVHSIYFVLIFLCTSGLLFFKLLQLICFPFVNNFENFSHTYKEYDFSTSETISRSAY